MANAYIKWSEFTDVGESQAGDVIVGLRAGVNVRYDFPGTGIKDSSGNYLFSYATAGAAAVNNLKLTNSLASIAPILSVVGADANINLALTPKGTGSLVLSGQKFPISDGTVNQLLTTNGAGQLSWATVATGVSSVSGTANRITSTGGANPVIDISAAYVGQTSLTTLGVVTVGTWDATVVGLTYGGTGAALVASNGGIFYSNATTGAILAGTATAGKVLQSGATAAPTWSTPTYPSASGSVGTILRSDGTNNVYTTATYPATTTINQILYSSANNIVTGLATGNSSVLVTSAGGVPSLSLALPSAVQVAVGSLNSGTAAGATTFWRGDGSWAIPAGTGVTSVSGTVNRITSTGGTTPVIDIDSGYVGQASITTLGTIGTGVWQGTPVALAYGGTNANLTASNGGIFYSTATAGAVLSGTATAGQMLRSGATAAPTWSTATFPATATGTGTILRADGTNWVATTSTFADTYAVSTILYASASNVVSGLAAANRAVLTSGATGIPVMTALATDGQVIIGSTAGVPAAATLSAGANITITNASNAITIASSSGGGGLGWTTVAGTTQAAAVNNGYIIGNAGQTTVTLPAVMTVGQAVAVKGLGAAGWVVTANAGQTIQVGQSATSVAGTVTSAANYDVIYLSCLVANTTWSMDSSVTSGFTIA